MSTATSARFEGPAAGCRTRLISAADHAIWDEFVMNHPEGTFFHLIGWKNVIESTFRYRSYYIIAEEQDRINAVLPFFAVKSRLFGSSLVSMAFGAYGGVLTLDENAVSPLMEKAQEITKQENLDYFELRNLYRQEADLPVKDLYYVFRREILPTVEENLQAIPRKARRMIRAGRDKYQLRSDIGREALLPEFYEIYARSVHQLGSPVYPKALFANLLREFKEDGEILLVRTPENKAIAGVMSFFYRDEILPYYAGSLPEGKEMAANDFMYWALMEYACEKGYKIFDFGRSKKDTGSFDFKRHWGFEPRPLCYQYYLHHLKSIPNISPVNPKYQARIELWKKLPLPVTKVLGPLIVKQIP
ncbi:MAG: FemAB family XrtA/PEP-CTERM system-associated protein [Pseudomonadota bacterium]